jgi:hypothetical protein
MPGSIRPWVTAGIAVVGAAVIAVAPFEPVPRGTEFRIANSAVEISATPSPIDFYPQVVMRTLANAGDLIDEYFAAPLPVVTAVAESHYLALADIVDAVERGDVVAVVTAVLRAIATPVVNLVKVAGSGEPFRMASSLIVRLALPIASSVLAAGSAVGDVIDALLDVDVVSAFSAVTNIPARIVDGFLNGRVDAETLENPGLLSPVATAPVADQLTGPVAFLIDSLQGVGETISPAPPAVGAGPIDEAGLGSTGVTAPERAPSQAPPPPSSGPDDAPSSSPPPNDRADGPGESSGPDDGSEPPPDNGDPTEGGTDAPASETDTAPAASSDDPASQSDTGTPQTHGDGTGGSSGAGAADSPDSATDSSP